MAVATIALVIYSYVTIREGKRNRRKDLVQRTLEEVYGPLYDILRQPKDDAESGSRHANFATEPKTTYAIPKDKFNAIRNIVNRFGHLIPDEYHSLLVNIMENSKEDFASNMYPFRDGDYRIWSHFENRRKELMKELQDLTSV